MNNLQKIIAIHTVYLTMVCLCGFAVVSFIGCGRKSPQQDADHVISNVHIVDSLNINSSHHSDTITDSALTFEEAIAGTAAPQSVIDNLVLLPVVYKSTDHRLHKGQLVVHKELEADLSELFRFMLDNDFVIEKAIPAVHYNWNDSLSMAHNNTYAFNYRNVSYSYHAIGRAIDINPKFNPLRWKNSNRPNEPLGAVCDTSVNGTLYPGHPLVEEFKKRGFRWGHSFSKYFDDHHFEKR